MAARHAHPGLVAVRAGIADKNGKREFSSGLLIAPRLVLTARHTVVGNGTARAGIEVWFAAGPRGAVGLTGPVLGAVVWAGAGMLDCALIELSVTAEVPESPEAPQADDAGRGAGAGCTAAESNGDNAGAQYAPEGFLPKQLLWGELVGTLPVVATLTGMPGFASLSTGEFAEVETARGRIDPGTYSASGRYAVNLDAWPEKWSDWQGVSGSAVTSPGEGHLIGVVGWSDKPLVGRRLTAVPVSALLADPDFRAVLERHLERVPELEPVELAPLLSRPLKPRTLGALLGADAGLTEFAGRANELAFLENWRDEPVDDGPDVKALLVTGRGGEGKTRLAIEFVGRSRRDGWTGGVLRQAVTPDEAAAAAHPGVPLLLVIDYAAARAAAVAGLAAKIVRARPSVPVRLLLLARAGGDWWADLTAELADVLPDLHAQVRPLAPLLAAKPSPSAVGAGPGADSDPAAATDAAEMFLSTAVALAPHVAQFSGGTPGELRQIAARLAVPDLSHMRYEHALTVQMAALAALLDAAAPASQPPVEVAANAEASTAERVENTLLRHEKRYRDRLASARGLDDLRLVRDRVIAGAALFGARGTTEADARLAACALVTAAIPEVDRQESRQREVAAWVADLYPPHPVNSADAEYWGQVLPDRLGEFLAVRLLASEEPDGGTFPPGRYRDDGAGGSLLAALSDRSDPDGTWRALLILSRAIEHDPRVAGWIARLVDDRPNDTAAIAIQVAAFTENPAPMREAVVQLSRHRPESLRAAMSALRSAQPGFSVRSMESSTSITREMVLICRILADHDRQGWLADLGRSLHTYAIRLGETGLHATAVTIAAEAAAIFRELAAHNRDTHLSDLASSVDGYAFQLFMTGQRDEALRLSSEALGLSRELASRDRDFYLQGLATALRNHAVRLAETGSPDAALDLSSEALGIYRELASLDRDLYLSSLAIALDNHAARLTEAGRRHQALSTSDEALSTYRELTSIDYGTYLPGLARTLSNHGLRLADVGRREDALATAAQAVAINRELANLNRGAFLPDLAASLTNYALQLADAGQRDQALSISAEGLAANRELAELNPGAHMQKLAIALSNHALRLSQNGHNAAALTASTEAVGLIRGLVRLNRDAYVPNLVKVLGNHSIALNAANRHYEALAASSETVEITRELTARNRDAYLPDLSVALMNHANALNAAGLLDAALTTSSAAVETLRELASVNRKAHLPDLAMALGNYAGLLVMANRYDSSLIVSAEALAAYRTLINLNRDAYLPGLTRVLAAHGWALVEKGQIADAVAVFVEAIQNAQALSDHERVPITEGFLVLLKQAHQADPIQVEAAYLRITGMSLPEPTVS